ncbi:MAG: anion permease [Ottowia sp.]|nr:anion permease [Ottowia sp.]
MRFSHADRAPEHTLILGPGGLKFGDYWRLGLSLEIVVVLVAVTMLLWVWPL